MSRQEVLGVLEGILFAVGSDGVNIAQLSYALEESMEFVQELLEELMVKYQQPESGFNLMELNEVYKLTTKKDHAPYLRRLMENPNQRGLSNAAMEVLAIIAYKQPITRHEVEHVRGTNSENVIRRLLTYSLIEEAGRLEAPGRPMLYQTTEEFLDYFGISTLEELPPLKAITSFAPEDESGEAELFTSNQTEIQRQTENLKTTV